MSYRKIIAESYILKNIGSISASLGIESYVIGGYVRDLILGINSKDIDIVCIGDATKLAKNVSKCIEGNPRVTIYKNYGTAKIGPLRDPIFQSNTPSLISLDSSTNLDDLPNSRTWEIEFVGARKESYNRNSRNPIVELGTLMDDQNRRDFTINALAISLNAKNFGELLDPFNGLKDLEDKLIKTPLEPDTTFSDDPLRILRAIRFATRLGFNIEEKTFKSMCENIDRLKIVSIHRIITEINNTILAKQPSNGFLLYLQAGILKLYLPEMCKLLGTEQIGKHTHKDNFYHTLKVLDNISNMSNNLWLRWAAILHDIAKPKTKRFDPNNGFSFHGHEDLGAKMAHKIFKRLALPLGKELNYVAKLIKLHLRPISLALDIVTESAFRRLLYEAGDDIDDLLTLCKADITTKNPANEREYLNNIQKVEDRLKEIEERDKIKNFKPVITGEIIMKVFKINPSRQVGDIKDKIKDAILDGKIKNTLEEAIPFMFDVAKEFSLKPVSKAHWRENIPK